VSAAVGHGQPSVTLQPPGRRRFWTDIYWIILQSKYMVGELIVSNLEPKKGAALRAWLEAAPSKIGRDAGISLPPVVI
jgi:hypothetical protein